MKKFQNIINIIKKQFPGIQPINGMRLKKWYNQNKEYSYQLQKLLKEVYIQLKSKTQVIYCIRNDIIYEDLCCQMCRQPIKVKRNITQRQKYCDKCKYIAGIQKRKDTILKNPTFWQDRQKKIQNTNLKKYNSKIAAQNQQVKNKIKQTAKLIDWNKRNNKSINTCIDRYNVTNPFRIPQVAQKSRTTWLNRSFTKAISYQNFQFLYQII